MEKRFDVFAMCNALYDLQAEVAEPVLTELSLTKGGMFLLSHAEQRAIVPRVYTDVVNTQAGGSGANTAIGVALLGGTAAFTSRVGADEHGRLYREGLAAAGVKPNLATGDGDTGVSLILVTPDAQRTMCTYLGLSQDLRAEDVNVEDIQASRYLYITGYLWDTETQKEAVARAMTIARDSGVPIAFSLSDRFCVERHRDDFLRLLREFVDVVFANQDEAMVLTGAPDGAAAAAQLAAMLKPSGAQIAAVTRDKTGSVVQAGGVAHEIPSYPVEAVDTTGAGDMYAAGLLFGLTKGMSLPAAGRIASYTAAQVVAKMGPRLDSIDAEAIRALSQTP
jgi:sugar/nucleoside kinase (ribokinase family)